MRVFVTGGTGFVGREVLRQLHAAGHAIRVLARNPESPSACAAVAHCSAEIYGGDVLDAASFAARLSGIDAVIHLVGIISEVGEQTFEKVHARGTQNIVAAAKRAGVTRLIHMSALGTRPDAASRYHRSKWAAEEIVRGSGLDYTILRPSIIYGPGDGFVNLFAKIARRSPVVPILGSGQTKFQPVAVEVVATCFVRSLAEPESILKTCDLCGPEVFTLAQIVDEILGVMGKRRIKLRLPIAVARIQATALEFIFPQLLHKPPPLNRDQLIMLLEDNVGNPGPANELFGLQHPSFEEGIARYLVRDA